MGDFAPPVPPREVRGLGSALRRFGLTAAMGVVALNIWTGSPLLAVWIGSQIQGYGPPTMTAVAVVVICFATFSFSLAMLLGWLGARHDALTGSQSTVRDHAPWLRSMRGERPLYPGMTAHTTTLERVLVLMVVVAVVAFEIWFFFFAGSPFAGS